MNFCMPAVYYRRGSMYEGGMADEQVCSRNNDPRATPHRDYHKFPLTSIPSPNKFHFIRHRCDNSSTRSPRSYHLLPNAIIINILYKCLKCIHRGHISLSHSAFQILRLQLKATLCHGLYTTYTSVY